MIWYFDVICNICGKFLVSIDSKMSFVILVTFICGLLAGKNSVKD